MINNVNEGNGGVIIKPSARKSIHAHCGSCPFIFNETMGRYGRYSPKRGGLSNASRQQEPQGSDVVDNSMSKMARPSYPLTIQKDGLRRNSVDAVTYDESDDSLEDLLSKSSPATFSQLNYSDELYRSAVQNENSISRNGQQTSFNSHLPQINSYDDGEIVNEWDSRSEKIVSSGGNKMKSTSMVILFGIVAIALGVNSNYLATQVVPTNNVSSELDFHDDIKSLGAKYKVNSDSILRIRTGLSTIFKNQDTASFIFVYDSKAENFNPLVFNTFMQELASKTVKFLRTNGDSPYVVVDAKTLNTDLELMDLQWDVDKTGVMLVPDIQELPSKLAMAFHFYCDEYNPLVKRSAIFFTLDSAACMYNNKLTHQIIEKCLSKKWNNIHEDKIGPLLTRVVNIIVDTTKIS